VAATVFLKLINTYPYTDIIPGVSFTNIIWAAFSHIFFKVQTSYLSTKKLLFELLYKEAARKMLVKLVGTSSYCVVSWMIDFFLSYQLTFVTQISFEFLMRLTLFLNLSLFLYPCPSLCAWIHFPHHYDHVTTSPKQNNHIYVHIYNNVITVVSSLINSI
jgi:hypothetical protein